MYVIACLNVENSLWMTATTCNFYFSYKKQKQASEVFYKKGVLRNFAIFIGKHLCQSLFLNKIGSLRPETLLKKRLWHRCFLLNFEKFLRTPFLQNTSGWLLLKKSTSQKKFFQNTSKNSLVGRCPVENLFSY